MASFHISNGGSFFNGIVTDLEGYIHTTADEWMAAGRRRIHRPSNRRVRRGLAPRMGRGNRRHVSRGSARGRGKFGKVAGGQLMTTDDQHKTPAEVLAELDELEASLERLKEEVYGT